LTVTALKNWLYCRRQVYFAEGLGMNPAATFKMKEGREAQKEVERLEVRRTLERYKLEGRERLFGRRLWSETLGVAGNPDLILRGEDAYAVVEFKLSEREPGPAEWLQMACYAALVEEQMGGKVDWMFGYRIPDGAVFPAAYSDGWRRRVGEVLAEVRACVGQQIDPGRVDEADRCEGCTYVNYCADVW
jgi:CRISPR-associated exonuclease Cas4